MDINVILRRDPRPAKHGAPMGDGDRIPDGGVLPKLHVQRIAFVDGDYGADGTYWGGSEPLYCAFDKRGTTRIYVRAVSRDQAIDILKDTYPDAKFWRY